MSNSESMAQQVSHWIHDEQACVTVQRVVQTFDLSWSAALSLLQKTPKEGNQYSVTQFASSNNGSTSKAFRLVKSSWNANADPEESSGWYSLALTACTESIHTAHEKDSSQFRDVIESFSVPSLLRPWDRAENDEASEGFASSIVVSEAMTERLVASGKRKATDAFSDQPTAPKAAARVVPTKKTATTARNFFGSKSSSTSKASTSIKSKATGSTNKGKGKTTKPPKNNSTLSFQPKKETIQPTSSKTTKQAVDEEKENVQNKKVGDADTMEFDEESSDEEMEEAPPSNARKETAKEKVSTKKNISLEQDDDDDVEEVSQPDSTADSKTSNSGAPKRRRKRKVMREKTAVDESGYLYTETQAVWEDIPSDEEEKEQAAIKTKAATKPANKSKSSSKPKALKQQSLMGFFSKKK